MLLFSENITPCGDLLEVWTETAADESWELHFHAVCDDCVKLAIEVGESIFPGVPRERIK